MANSGQGHGAETSQKELSGKIRDVLTGIRVPDLPYPAGPVTPDSVCDWRPLLLDCWNQQRDERVIHVIRSVDLPWSVKQVNSAYVADRIMDVFLKTSGLHPELALRIARLRFYFAWRLHASGAEAFTDTLIEWLDSLQEWRGWSCSGSRSEKVLLDMLSKLLGAVSSGFESADTGPVEHFCLQWQADSSRRGAQVGRLRQRLLDTEQGAARQRRADQTARALLGRALEGRQLAAPVVRFIFDVWFGLLKQAAWVGGVDGEAFRHGSRLLEWLVWLGDPTLSDKDQDRLYHVGEQIGDRLHEVWSRIFDTPLPADALAGIDRVLVSRLRGEVPELEPALPPGGQFSWSSEWLDFRPVDAEAVTAAEGRWYVQGEGSKEQRRYFFALLEDTAEILWTNGAGVKLGVQAWSEFEAERTEGVLRPLPDLTPFGKVLTDTVDVLARVSGKQVKLREQASREARERAEALRRQREAAEQARREHEAAQAEQLRRQQLLAEKQRLDDEKAVQESLYQEALATARKQVAGIKLGGWITLLPDPPGDEPLRLKLAVRINASRKLVFVDRLGLNRREFLEDPLAEEIVAGRVRVLGTAAEFDDTLSRVVGRIRVGRN